VEDPGLDQDAITRERDCTASVEAADYMALILQRHPAPLALWMLAGTLDRSGDAARNPPT